MLLVAAASATLLAAGDPSGLSASPSGQAVDTDGDGWTDEVELFIGTLPNQKCSTTMVANDEDPDAYPPDTTDSRGVNTQDIGKFVPHLNSHDGDGRYRNRYDFTMDGRVNTIDIAKYIPILGTVCIP